VTLLVNPVTFGAVVRYRDDGLHYLVVGFADRARSYAMCARPDGSERLVHVHWLSVIKPPQRFVPNGRRQR